jgi:hypothetical protein
MNHRPGELNRANSDLSCSGDRGPVKNCYTWRATLKKRLARTGLSASGSGGWDGSNRKARTEPGGDVGDRTIPRARLSNRQIWSRPGCVRPVGVSLRRPTLWFVGATMRVRALIFLSALPIVLVTAPSVAWAQGIAARDCWSLPDWNAWNACVRRRGYDAASAERRASAAARAAERSTANAERIASHRAGAAARTETQAWARAMERHERTERARIRAAERAHERHSSYTRRW